MQEGEVTTDNTNFYKLKNKYKELCSDSSFNCNVVEAPNLGKVFVISKQ